MKRSFMIKIKSFLKKSASKRKPRRSACTGSSLPEEMVVDILVKLPEQSLPRFKCLSTSFHNLIESSDFIAAQADHRRKNGKGIFLLGYRDVISTPNGTDHNISGDCSFSMPYLKNPNVEHPFLEYVGSSNGLVCLNIFDDGNRSSLINMVVWNPATSNFSFAPHPPPLIIPSDYGRVVYGFGYDSVSHDYKSIRLFVCGMTGPLVEVLSWGKRSWTELTDQKLSCLDERVLGIQPYPVTSKGRVTWMVVNIRSSSTMLLSFKLGEEEFEWISPLLNNHSGKKTACAWKGSLAMLIEEGAGNIHSLWLFNDGDDRDRNSCCWSKLFTVQMDDYPCEWVSEPDNNWKSFLVYRYDDRLALASMAGELRSRVGYHIQRGFEFTATSVPVPGSGASLVVDV